MSKKAEARIARKAARLLRQQEKSARLRTRPAADRSVRLGADPKSIYGMMMVWNQDSADKAGIWSWGISRNWVEDDWKNIIHPKLLEWEKLLWREIETFTTDGGHRAHHLMPVGRICNESQGRLEELKADGKLDFDSDEIYRFRLGNRRRLWGFRIVNEFDVLWYDPTHQIYPTEPD